MKHLNILILAFLIGACQHDSHWIDDSNLHIKTENQTFTFSEEAKDSLQSIINQFKEDQEARELFFTDLLYKTDMRSFPHPDIFDKYGDVYSDEDYRFILLTSSTDFPDNYFITDKFYNDNLYDAISFTTDPSGTTFFEMSYITFDTLNVSYSEDFFPVHIFSQEVPQEFDYVEQLETEISESRSQRYQKYFYRLNEESLFKNCHEDLIKYRISWFPSFDPPFSISVVSNQDKKILSGKRMIEAPYENKLAVDYIKTESTLSPEQWLNVLSKIDELTFWELSPIQKKYSIKSDTTLQFSVGGNDGARWLIEGCKLGKYHLTDRWSGFIDEDYRNLFNYLIQLANFDEDITKLY